MTSTYILVEKEKKKRQNNLDTPDSRVWVQTKAVVDIRGNKGFLKL